jgi:hypothetical protein
VFSFLHPPGNAPRRAAWNPLPSPNDFDQNLISLYNCREMKTIADFNNLIFSVSSVANETFIRGLVNLFSYFKRKRPSF